MICFGGPVFPEQEALGRDPERYAYLAKKMGYRAIYAPSYLREAKSDEIRKARTVFEREGLIVAEAGYWENLLDTRPEIRKKNRQEMLQTYQMAEELGALCVVNTIGFYCEGNGWYHHSAENFAPQYLEEAAQMARDFIDAVQPKHTAFTYEMFMYCGLDSPEAYAQLIRMVDREHFGAHVDYTNLMVSPREVFAGADIIRRCIELFADRILSVHVKDVRLETPALSTRILEAVPGEGVADLTALLKACAALPQTVPLMLEHLEKEDEYQRGLAHLKQLAQENHIDY